ncbi:MAG: class I SAM-dependent methyltransferase [Patescibacteria group bacterium]|nr:class I SAM-dependent methyltransferase [Patescibacteria group bacterium]
MDKKTRECPICSSKKIKPLLEKAVDKEYGDKGNWDIYFCPECQVGFQNPLPVLNNSLENYPPQYSQYHPRRGTLLKKLYQAYLQKKAKKIEKLIGQEGNILEVGCGVGQSIKVLSGYGKWKMVGLEPIDYPIKEGKKIGVHILKGTLSSLAKKEKEKYDLILMLHVLEHLPDPKSDLKYAYQLLKPGGYIVGETENLLSWDFKILEKFWGLLALPRHIFFFTKDSLRLLAQKNDFKTIEINFQPNTEGWALGCQFFLQEKIFRKQLNKRAFYYPILLAIFLPLSLTQTFFKASGVVEFVFKKNL